MKKIKELIDKRRIRYQRVDEQLVSADLLNLDPDKLASMHPSDLADLIEDLPHEKQVEIFGRLDDFHAAQVLTNIEDEQQLVIARAFGLKQLTHLLENMPSDHIADLLNKFSQEKIDELLDLMEEDDRKNVVELLSYAEDSAGGVMVKELVDFYPETKVKEAIEILRSEFEPHDFIGYLYITNKQKELLGVISLKELILAPEDIKLEEIMAKDVIAASIEEDQEKIAWLATKYEVQAIPVVDHVNRLVGLVTPQDIAEIIQEEHDEDIYRMAGLDEEVELCSTNPLKSAMHRFPWLFLTMGAGLLASGIISENTMAEHVWLLSFSTLICGLAGNIAIQTSTVIIRHLAQNQWNKIIPLKQLFKEIAAGMSLALLCSVTIGIIVAFRDGVSLHGFVVGCSVFSVVCLAVSLAVVIPNFFHRLGVDPAVSSGPLITTLTDVLGLSIYFSCAYYIISYLS